MFKSWKSLLMFTLFHVHCLTDVDFIGLNVFVCVLYGVRHSQFLFSQDTRVEITACEA